MKQLIEKEMKTGKKLKIASLVLGICTVITFFLVIEKIIHLVCLFFFLVPAAVFLGIYFGRYPKLNKCWKGLTEAQKDYYVQGMDPDRYTLQYSRIYCGFNAVFATRPYVILPYSEIAWIYYEHTRAEDSDEVVGLNIRCRNGKKFQIEGHDAELKVYAESYIPENFPDILVGWSKENRKKYYELIQKQE